MNEEIMERIAEALERIADSLDSIERHQGSIALDVEAVVTYDRNAIRVLTENGDR